MYDEIYEMLTNVSNDEYIEIFNEVYEYEGLRVFLDRESDNYLLLDHYHETFETSYDLCDLIDLDDLIKEILEDESYATDLLDRYEY